MTETLPIDTLGLIKVPDSVANKRSDAGEPKLGIKDNLFRSGLFSCPLSAVYKTPFPTNSTALIGALNCRRDQ